MRDKGFRKNYEHVFKKNGFYGGNQNSPKNDPKRYARIVRKYFKDYTDEQVSELLIKLSNEGCGYVALVNTIFLRFLDDSTAFEKAFGYPMYTDSGALNFNDLIVDFYCATDNHVKHLWFDTVDKKEDDGYPNGYGTDNDKRKWRFETYMNKHGINVDVRNINPSLSEIDSYMNSGPLMIAISPTFLYDLDGNRVKSIEGGHSMLVTGVMLNNLIRVSSWGEVYYVKSGSYLGYETYQQVIYK